MAGPRVESRRVRTVGPVERRGILLNDVHSQLNETRVDRVIRVRDADDLCWAVRQARATSRAICVGGGKHAMGAQQFAADGIYLDTRTLSAVRSFDRSRGLIEVEAGIQWPELIDYLHEVQPRHGPAWAIRQKQTGADRLTIGGALSANAHGRGLTMKPFIGDVEALTLVDARGELVRCSRGENAELFSLVAGGYGLFGVIATVTLRLAPRRVVERIVEIETIDRAIASFERRIAEGFEYGDFQFAIDPRSDDFLRRGVLSCYRAVEADAPPPDDEQKSLSVADWETLLYCAHADKQRAWELYAAHYLSTSGQRYWSDQHQLSTYIDDYHRRLDVALGNACRATEMITELYVPRSRLADFMQECAGDFRRHDVDCIYGTVRLIERDDESFLPWARDRYACVIFNLHTEHTPAGLAHASAAFRRLIDRAADRGGSYYLTYHKFAPREQVERCYPELPAFLAKKRDYDPDERFQSEWYRTYRDS